MSECPGLRCCDSRQLQLGIAFALDSGATRHPRRLNVKLVRLMLLALVPALALTLAGCGDTTTPADMPVTTPQDMAQKG
jgi:hypothetical protein